MDRKIVIYGKDTCPYTNKALEVYAKRGFKVEYIDVIKNEASLDEMLIHTAGKRVVPVIVEGDKVSIGLRGT
jgi:glutaredoxin 3